MGGMGLGLQAGQPRLMEGMAGFTDALVAAMELGADLQIGGLVSGSPVPLD